MSIPGAASPLFLATAAGGAAGDFEISRSLRFNSADSAYLNRTPSSAGNRKKFTYSAWVKRSKISTTQNLFGIVNAATQERFQFGSNNQIYFVYSQGTLNLTAAAVFRDVSSWYHIVLAVNTDDGTASDRVKLYVNGARQTLSGTNPSSGQQFDFNNTVQHRIGSFNDGGNNYHYADYYMAEATVVDGSQLDPTSFGAFDDNGVWQAIDTAGLTFGTNGFRLKFADNSSDAALGTDSSGNSNTFTVNNLVATAGLATANQGFDVVTYTGNGGTQSISSLAFQPDFVWIKNRDESINNALYDSVRGNTKVLFSNKTEAEATVGDFSSFNSDGFTVAYANRQETNKNNINYVAWCWKAGGAASSNTDGTITSSVSVNTTYGFSIVSYNSGSLTGNYTLGHGLSSAPKFIIHKSRSTSNWWVFHSSVIDDTAKYLQLNSTNAVDTNSAPMWGAALPTSSVFGIRVGDLIGTSQDAIAYVWSEVAGFSKFGSYTGNGSSSGPTITTGFKPKWIIFKCASTNNGYTFWDIIDTARPNTLAADLSDAEGSYNLGTGRGVTILDDGFQIAGAGSGKNINNETYIYAAFAAKPDGSVIDSLVDSPTNAATPSDTGAGGEVVGNYCTWNPLAREANRFTFANGNLNVSGNAQNYGISGTLFVGGSGKYYFELNCNSNVTYPVLGVVSAKAVATDMQDGSIASGLEYGGPVYGFMPGYGPRIVTQTTTNTWSGVSQSTPAAGDIYGVAIDFDNGAIYFAKNGTWLSSGNPASGSSKTGAAFTSIEAGDYTPLIHDWGSADTINFDLNAGQRAFAYSAPTNFKALNTANLPTPTIADGSTAMDAKLYTGNGSTQTISGLGFSPDLVWLKVRGSVGDHGLWDIVRGTTKRLVSNTTVSESTVSGVTAFNSDGFSLGAAYNVNSSTYVAWTWDAGTSTVTNNDGSITSQVRANPTAGFSIITATTPASPTTNYSVGHGLNAAPAMWIWKFTSTTSNWTTWHTSLGSSVVSLNTTGAATGNYITAPTSSIIWLKDGPTAAWNSPFVLYAFAPVAGYSAMGSYTGNGSTDGVFVHTGFKVAFLLTKRTDTSENWEIRDIRRNPYNRTNRALFPHTSGTEDNGSVDFDFLSNGFKLRNVNGSTNANGGTYIYYAVAANPFQANGGLAR